MKPKGDAIAERRAGASKAKRTARLTGTATNTQSQNGNSARSSKAAKGKAPKPNGNIARISHVESKALNGKARKPNGSAASVAKAPKSGDVRKMAARGGETSRFLPVEPRATVRREGRGAGDWLLANAPFALALYENGRIAVSNERFQDMSRHRTGQSWLPCDAEAPTDDTPGSSLSRLVTGTLATALRDGCAPTKRVYRREGADQYVEACIWPCPGESASKRAMVLLRDATEQGRAIVERDLLLAALTQHERLRAIGELACGVTHDLNNTFHAINLRLSFIQNNAACIAEQGENIAALSRIINDAALVVGRLQDFARQQHDRPLESVDLVRVVQEAIEMVRTTIEGQTSLSGVPVRIQTHLPPLPRVNVQASDLRHVIANLLLNARDAMPHGGNIDVVGREQDGRVIVEVIDEGCGIPDSDLEKIFFPFFTTKGNRGTGLGLSNARRVLGILGADIRAANRPEGGACFTLSFCTAPSIPAPVEPRRASNPPPGRHILVIDDHADNREATKMVMECQGQSVDVAATGAEALDRLRAGARYDLVFCDLGMPDMNGWRVAREIQKVAPGTIVYLLTGWAQQIEDEDPRRRWVKGVLEKPMDPELMRELLSRELEDMPDSLALRGLVLRPVRGFSGAD